MEAPNKQETYLVDKSGLKSHQPHTVTHHFPLVVLWYSQRPTWILPLRELVFTVCWLGPAPQGSPSTARSHKFTASSLVISACLLPTVSSLSCTFPVCCMKFYTWKDFVNHLSVTPMKYNTPSSSYNSSPAAGELQQSKAPIREVTLRVCTEVVTALLVTAEVEVTPCSKSSPFGCCLIVQTTLGLLCVKWQVNCLAYWPIPVPAFLGALPKIAR